MSNELDIHSMVGGLQHRMEHRLTRTQGLLTTSHSTQTGRSINIQPHSISTTELEVLMN